MSQVSGLNLAAHQERSQRLSLVRKNKRLSAELESMKKGAAAKLQLELGVVKKDVELKFSLERTHMETKLTEAVLSREAAESLHRNAMATVSVTLLKMKMLR